MINIWEAIQGVAFMAALGLITRGAARRSPSEPAATPAKTRIPAPRGTAETQERTEA